MFLSCLETQENDKIMGVVFFFLLKFMLEVFKIIVYKTRESK